jgi:hypothetical protein
MMIGIKEVSVIILAAVAVVVAVEYWPSGHTVTAKAPPALTAAEAAQFECAKKELWDYSQATIARFSGQADPVARVLSVESILAERRREEQHCLRLTSCFYPDPRSIEYGAYFSSCLAPTSERANDN